MACARYHAAVCSGVRPAGRTPHDARASPLRSCSTFPHGCVAPGRTGGGAGHGLRPQGVPQAQSCSRNEGSEADSSPQSAIITFLL
eukprot:2299777-Prymnesium_polylepis.1